MVDETKARWFGCSVGKLTMEQRGGWLEHTQFTSKNFQIAQTKATNMCETLKFVQEQFEYEAELGI